MGSSVRENSAPSEKEILLMLLRLADTPEQVNKILRLASSEIPLLQTLPGKIAFLQQVTGVSILRRFSLSGNSEYQEKILQDDYHALVVALLTEGISSIPQE